MCSVVTQDGPHCITTRAVIPGLGEQPHGLFPRLSAPFKFQSNLNPIPHLSRILAISLSLALSLSLSRSLARAVSLMCACARRTPTTL